MNGAEAARKRTLQQMMAVAQREKLTIMSPRDNKKIPFRMSEFDFRNTVLDFPMTINPDNLALLVEYYKEGRWVNYAKFIDDLLSSVDPPAPAVKAKDPNPKYVALAKHLYERNTDLISLIKFMDRNSNGKITAENFARALTDFPLAKDVARISMDLKTREIDYLKLQELLDSIEVNTPKEAPKPVTDGLPSCFPKFVHLLKSRSIPIDEYFMREHRTKTGMLPRDKFFTLLYQLNLPLPREQIEEIADFFSDQNGNVDYAKFIASTSIKDKDDYTPPPPEIDVEKAVQRVVDNFKDRKLNIWSLFKPHDRQGTGKVPRTLFLKTINSFNFDMDKEEVRVAVESLGDDETKTVDYVEFAKRVCQDRQIDFNETTESSLQKLRDFLMNKKLMLHKYLGIYDRDKSGLITTNQFLAAMRKMGYDIDDHDLRLLKEAYEDKKTRHYIHWKALCEDVDITYGDQSATTTQTDNISITPSMRELLTSSSKQIQLYKTQELASGNPRDSRPIPDHLIPLYAKIDRALNEFGFDLEGELISCDRFKKGTVTRVAFKQILDLLPMTIPPEQLDELIQFYCDETSNKIYYLSFTKDLDEFGTQSNDNGSVETDETGSPKKDKKLITTWEDEVEVPNNITYNTRMSQPIDTLPEDVKPLLSRIYDYNHVHSTTTYEYFRILDKLHNGLIESAAVQRAFGSTGIHFSPSEFKLLIDTFRDEEKPDYVNYLRICKAVDAIDKNENNIGMIPLTHAEEQSVWHVVNRIQTTLRNKRSNLRFLFSREQNDIISSRQLFNLIEEVGGVILNANDRKLLIKKYHVTASGDINWKQLCDDSEKTIRLL
ncbi:EF hand family protein [Tritrichomonas foetus]|uniref:EF hand family protein n=1 Tax=Tritrichomonas foetus TaxID=1144522 RepID=A0A1J4KCD1_9EUKA|nr:EF hand family protein [Tritrichomonas foetus]|eukprot:OHT07302.1 EF hand family protein [Tritrichomonas foetus]